MSEVAPESKPKAPSTKEIWAEILNALNRDPAPLSKVKMLDAVFHTYEPAPGHRVLILAHPDEVMEIVSESYLVNMLVSHLHKNTPLLFHLEEREAVRLVRTWIAQRDPIKIANILWRDERGPCFTRLKWNKVEAPCPTWEKLYERMHNGKAFYQWIGSLFFEGSYQQQYVWLYGEGADGKGSISRFLQKIFGRAYRATQVPAPGDRFWTNGLIGTRICVFPDCNNVSFPSSGLFKALTGGDPIEVEAKFKDSYTFIPNAKYLFLSNERPHLSSELADLRRAILVEFKPEVAKIDSEDFEGDLWKEGGGFLFACVDAYKSVYGGTKPIVSESERLEDHISIIEEEFQTALDKWFRLDGDPALRAVGADGLPKTSYVEPHRMQEILAACFDSRKQRLEFIAWLEKKHGIVKKLVRSPNEVITRRYVGLAAYSYTAQPLANVTGA